jgi:peptidase M50-like protein
MSSAPRRARRWHPAVIGLGLPALVAAGALAAWLLDRDEAVALLLGLLAFWVAFLVNVAVHELGHLAAGRIVGIGASRIVLGPLELVRDANRWSARLCRDWFSLGGGLVLLTPPPRTARHMAWVAAGGPVASLALLVASLALLRRPWWSWETIATPVRALDAFTALGALVTLLTNLVPAQRTPAGKPSDGYVIRQNLARCRHNRSAAPWPGVSPPPAS